MVGVACPQCGAEFSVRTVAMIHAQGFSRAGVAPPARPALAALRLRWSEYSVVVFPSLIVLFAQSSGSAAGAAVLGTAVASVWLTQYLVRRSRLRTASRDYRAQFAIWRRLFGCLRCEIVFLPDDAALDADRGGCAPAADTSEFIRQCAARAATRATAVAG